MAKNDILKKLPLDPYSVHCIGIGGIGVSAIAELLLDCGCKISGSDAEFNSNCAHLAERGAVISAAGHRVENIPAYPIGGAIMTAAADLNNPEAKALLRSNVMLWRRGEFLGELCRTYRHPVMVAGSHGKSSTSAMLGWIFKKCQIDAGLLLGAHYQDKSSNACAGNGDILLAEADESDNSIKFLSGELALITNIDGDHAWSDKELQEQYAAFRMFASAFKKVIFLDSAICRELLCSHPNAVELSGSCLEKLLQTVPERFIGYERLNAALAVAGAKYFNISAKQAVQALETYPGLERRQGELLKSCSNRLILLEDYAHHPTELAASLEVIRKRYEQYHITLLFQPHRYQRLRHYFQDFANILSNKSLTVKVLPVFSAWEPTPVDAVDSGDLAAAINRLGGNASTMPLLPGAAAALVEELYKTGGNQLIALIGAGDLNELIPEIKKAMQTIDASQKVG